MKKMKTKSTKSAVTAPSEPSADISVETELAKANELVNNTVLIGQASDKRSKTKAKTLNEIRLELQEDRNAVRTGKLAVVRAREIIHNSLAELQFLKEARKQLRDLTLFGGKRSRKR